MFSLLLILAKPVNLLPTDKQLARAEAIIASNEATKVAKIVKLELRKAKRKPRNVH